jgi:hypothetical protein
MLLRRVMQHVREQNWFAVGIDFLIVVTGVFIGIQVANWNAALQEHRRESLILDRLRADFQIIEHEAEVSVAFHQRNLDGLQTVIETLASGVLPVDEEASFRSGLRYAYTHRNATGRSATFIEVLSSGQVSLLRDEGLRTALIAYDNDVQQSEQVFMQIRMHQSAHIAALTIRFDYEIPARVLFEEDGRAQYQPVGDFDLEGMLTDLAFKNAAHELREANRYYYQWHMGNLNLARNVIERLNGGGE